MKATDQPKPVPRPGVFGTGAPGLGTSGIFVVGIWPMPVFELFPLAANAIFLGH